MESNEVSNTDVLALLGCCALALFAVVGVIALIVKLSKRAPVAPPNAPGTTGTPAEGPLHLSVLAFSFDSFFRTEVEQALGQPLTSPDVIGQRVELVRRFSQLVLGLEPQWRDFGYGEKDLAQLADTRTSFMAAVSDFRARAQAPGDEGPLVVLTLVLATRTVLKGVSALDDRGQARAVLDDRLQVDRGNLLGAEIVWSPSVGGVTEPALRERFPEMQELR
jgi:hypothetical protein